MTVEEKKATADEICALAMDGIDQTNALPLEYPIAEGATIRAIFYRIQDLANQIFEGETE